MKASFEILTKCKLEKEQMSEIKGGTHLEYIDGKWVMVKDLCGLDPSFYTNAISSFATTQASPIKKY
ncbi:MAG: hypothetical protein LBQ73_05960 [Tannerellaceae bacterium]|jgi:hypothetical protein|nr:hypothetical protein [Tannerellaceae bacterium]